MTNDPVNLLLAEHDVIGGANEVVAAIDRLWMTDPGAYRRAVGELLSFFDSYSDGYHHRKEESVLFPELRDHPDFYGQAILDELEEHHQDFRDRVASIGRAIEAGDYEGTQASLTRYLDELLDHIAVENDELFVMAGSLLSEGELERVYFRFKDIDGELGKDRKAELERQLADLRAAL